MTERPILFRGQMCLPIMADVKTVTRRIAPKNRWGVKGDRLWVKETWRVVEREGDAVDGVLYRADLAFVPIHNTREAADLWVEAHDNGSHGEKWRTPIHMFRWASRTTLALTDNPRQEFLHDITAAEAIAEGVLHGENLRQWDGNPYWPKALFKSLWISINGQPSWDENPLVWRVPFRRLNLKLGGVE